MAIEVLDEQFESEVLKSDIPVLVDFWAPWCGPCRIIAPSLEEISKEYSGKIKVVKVNVDEAYQTATQYGIMSIPTLMVFKNGAVVDKVIGALPKSEIENMINKHIS